MTQLSITQDWGNFAYHDAREQLRAAAADLTFPALGLNPQKDRLKYLETWETAASFPSTAETWITGNEILPQHMRSGRLRYFSGLQRLIQYGAGNYIYTLWVKQGREKLPWYGSANPFGTGPGLRWIFEQAGLMDPENGGWGWRFSPGTEIELNITDPTHKPVVYYPFSTDDSYYLSADDYLTPNHRAEAGHIAGPWLTQDLSMILAFLVSCRDNGIWATIADNWTLATVPTMAWTWRDYINLQLTEAATQLTRFTQVDEPTEMPTQMAVYQDTAISGETEFDTTYRTVFGTQGSLVPTIAQTSVIKIYSTLVGITGNNMYTSVPSYELVPGENSFDEWVWTEVGWRAVETWHVFGTYDDTTGFSLVDTTVYAALSIQTSGYYLAQTQADAEQTTETFLRYSTGYTDKTGQTQVPAGFSTITEQTWTVWTEPEFEAGSETIWTDITTVLPPTDLSRFLSVITTDGDYSELLTI